MPSYSRAPGRSSEGRLSASRRSSAHLDDAEEQPSPGKRAKRQHTPNKISAHTSPRASKTEAMYSFQTNVIDLTSSPPRRPAGSPQQRRASNATKPPGPSNASSAPKKLVVKNLRQPARQDPEKYLTQVWDQLDAALTTILSEDTKHYSLEELYRGVENVCRQNWASELSKRLRARCSSHIANVIRPRLLKDKSAQAGVVLEKVVDEWLRWRKQNAIIKAIFFYLDRSYLLHSSSEQTIDTMCIELFRDKIYHNADFKAKIVDGICGLLAADRGQQLATKFDPELFRHAIGMFHAMTVYTVEIESKLLGASQTYFIEWADEHGSKDDLKQFLKLSQELKAAELKRCDIYALSDPTKRELTQQIDKYLIERQIDQLTNNDGVAKLIRDNDIETLANLFEWLQVKQLGETLSKPVAKFIDVEGTQIIFDEKREGEMVVRLLQLKREVDAVHERAFAKNQSLGHAMREAFNEFMNKNKRDETTGGAGNDKPGEMIAKYVDIILKGGTKAIPQASGDGPAIEDDAQRQDDERDEEKLINEELDRVLDLFRFVQGKATFEAFYKKDLAKRLLMNRSASADAEKSMLTRLRQNCGSSFTHNLEQMFKDIERSREENAAYKALLEDRNTHPATDLSVNTLSAAAWPSYPDPEVAIPANIQKATIAFETHYKSKYVGRKLDWKHGLAHCQMRARFPLGQKELVLSSFQAIVLLQFNDRQDNAPVLYSELQDATKLSDAELQRTLQSLACAKYRVLSKIPRGKDVKPTDQFSVNMAFKNDRARIKINQIQLKETPEEQKQTHERVAADRQFETQAAIVRILKAKKKIKHALLVAEVISALKSRGAINADDIKKQIEKLIDKDYMERVENGTYQYVA